MPELHPVVATAFATVLALGFVSGFLKNRSLVSRPVLAILIGFVAGPEVLGLADLDALGDKHAILRETARYTIGVSVMVAALRLPPRWLLRHAGSWALFLTVGMLAMWGASGGIAAWALGLPLWPALLLGAVVTPTDPVLAGSIVESEVAEARIPRDPRHLISAEAGANDGLALPFVVLALWMVQSEFAWGRYALDVLLVEIGGALALGAVLGVVAATLAREAQTYRLSGGASEAVTTFATGILAVGLGRALGLDGILAAFVAGVGYSAMRHREIEKREMSFDTEVKRLFELPVFVLLGLALPVSAWTEGGWPLVLFAFGIVFLRRPPVFAFLSRLTSCAPRWAEAFYIAWFGPIGIAALFYALHVTHELREPAYFEIVSLVIVLSAVLHGFSAEPVARRFPQG